VTERTVKSVRAKKGAPTEGPYRGPNAGLDLDARPNEEIDQLSVVVVALISQL
jgi:hypothetical protein